MSRLVFNNNGYHGKVGSAGAKGASGRGYGNHGGCGHAGGPGEDAGAAGTVDVYFSATSDEKGIVVKSIMGSRPRSNYSSNSVTLAMGDPGHEVAISAVGGTGGQGGRGGDGGAGAGGAPGAPATRYSSGGAGGPGGNGGPGGQGGRGGRGGNGANISIYCGQPDMDTLMLLRQRVSPTNGGPGGAGGAGGNGGPGGPGGPGGASYSWSETTYSNGNSYTTTYTNPGGPPGRSGSRGPNGPSGPYGSSGSAGIYTITLTMENGAKNIYHAPYDLQLMDIQYIDTVGYNVIEPAADVNLTVSHKNVGGMPTPSHQLVRSFVRDNTWVNCPVANRVIIKKWIVQNECVRIPKPILFTITDVHKPSLGDPFRAIGTMEHIALVDRVNQDFGRVRNVKTKFTIEYPIQASLVRGGTAIAFGEEAPMVFYMWNKSRLPIGKDGAPSRYLSSRLNLDFNTVGGSLKLEHDDVELRSFDGSVFQDTAGGIFTEIPRIVQDQKKYFACTLKFVNPDIKPYTRMSSYSGLWLGHVKDMQVPKNIQIRPFEVQLAESYCRLAEAEVLLIVNNRSEYDEVMAWRALCDSIDNKCVVWNVNLYGDLCMDHVRKDGHTLLEDFRCSTMIFINNPFLRDEKLNQHTSEFLRSRELFLAARDHGINTLIFGSDAGVDFKKELIPALSTPGPSAYFKNAQILLKTIERRLAPGEGSAQAYPATKQATVCGVLRVKGNKSWCSLHLEAKTLCYYKSAKQQFPEGIIYLENFIMFVDEKADMSEAGASFDIYDANGKVHCFKVMRPNEYKRKEANYGKRNGYCRGGVEWLKVLQTLTTDVRKRESSDNKKTIEKKVLAQPDGAERKSIRQSLGAAAIPTFGWMFKRGGEKKAFKKRWFIFDPVKKTLSWHKKEGDDSMVPQGILYMGRYSLKSGDYYGLEKSDVDTKFQILTPARSLFLRAENVKDRDRWIAAFVQAVNPIVDSGIFSEQSTSLKETHHVYRSMGSGLSVGDFSQSTLADSPSTPPVEASEGGPRRKKQRPLSSISVSKLDRSSTSTRLPVKIGTQNRSSIRSVSLIKGESLVGANGQKKKFDSTPALTVSKKAKGKSKLKEEKESDEEGGEGEGSKVVIKAESKEMEVASEDDDNDEATEKEKDLEDQPSFATFAGSIDIEHDDFIKEAKDALLVQHNFVAVIGVEERYLIFSPKEKDLKKKAKKLHKKLQARFPNQRNIVVYNFNAKKEKRGLGLFVLGDLEIHRSLDCTATHLVHCPVEDAKIHQVDQITSRAAMYGVLKAMDYKRKLTILEREMHSAKDANMEKLCPPEPESGSSSSTSLLGSTSSSSILWMADVLDQKRLAMLMMAIISDIADEQYHFRASTWSEGLDSQMIRSRLLKLDLLCDWEFPDLKKMSTPAERVKSVIGNILLEIGAHISIMIRSHSTSFWDKVLPGRRSTVVNKATSNLWNQIVMIQFFGLSRNATSNEKQKAVDKESLKMITTIIDGKKKAWAIYAAQHLPNWGYTLKKKGKKEVKVTMSAIRCKYSAMLKAYYRPPGIAGLSDSSLECPAILTKKEFQGMVQPNRQDLVKEDKFLFKNDAMRLEAIDEVQNIHGCPPSDMMKERCVLEPGRNKLPDEKMDFKKEDFKQGEALKEEEEDEEDVAGDEKGVGKLEEDEIEVRDVEGEDLQKREEAERVEVVENNESNEESNEEERKLDSSAEGQEKGEEGETKIEETTERKSEPDANEGEKEKKAREGQNVEAESKAELKTEAETKVEEKKEVKESASPPASLPPSLVSE